MRYLVLPIALLAVTACNGTTAPPAPSTSTAVAASASATPTSVATPSSTTSAPAPTTTSTIAVPTAAPTFTYVEGTDELTFWAPTTLRLVRAGATPKTCMSQLSTGKDNMWTGPDVEAAFANADVQAAIKRGAKQSYLPEIGDSGVMTEGVLKTTSGSLEWKLVPCHWCVAPPTSIVHLHRVLAGVMMNRRLLCP